MWSSFTTMGACVLVLAILTVLLLILVARPQRTGRDVAIWFFSGLAGVLLGVAGSIAVVGLGQFELVRSSVEIPPEALAAMGGSASSAPGGPPVMPDMMPGMGGGGMGGFGGAPSPQRQLTSLVRKLELLTSDLNLDLSAEQTAELAKHLQGLDTAEKLTEDDAKAKYDAILDLLTDEQKAKEAAIGLPRPQGGPGGPGGGAGMGSGGPGGAAAAPDSNPFREGSGSDALKKLNERLGGQPATPAPPEPTAEKQP